MKSARRFTRWFFARQFLAKDDEYRFWNSRALYSLMMRVPYGLFRKEKFCSCLLYDAVRLMEPWFCDDSRQTFVLPRSIITRRFFPFLDIEPRIVLIDSSISVTFHANGRIILCNSASFSRACDWLHERAPVVHTSLIKSSHVHQSSRDF